MVTDFDICKGFDTGLHSADTAAVAVVAAVDEIRQEMLDSLH